jgi:hypothetical protein
MEILIGITSYGISGQQRNIDSISRCCWNVAKITCFHVFSSVLLCPLRFPRKIDVQFILAPICYIGDLCFDYFFCIYLPILVSNTMFMSDDLFNLSFHNITQKRNMFEINQTRLEIP